MTLITSLSLSAPILEEQLGSRSRINIKAMPRVLARLTRLALNYPGLSALAVVCALGGTIFNLLTPRLLGQAVNQAHHLLVNGQADSSAAQHTLLVTALLIIGACTLRGTLTGIHGFLGERIAQHVGYDLRLAFYRKLQNLSFSFHDINHSGDLIARGMLDLEGVRGFLESGVLRFITLIMLLSVGSWRVIHADPVLGLLSLSFVPFVVWRATRMGLLLRVTWNRLQELLSDLTLNMEENLQGSRVVRAFASKTFELAKFDRIAQAALLLSNRRIVIRMASMSMMNFAYYTAMGLVLFIGGRRVGAGTLSIGSLTEFITFMSILQQPVRQVGMIVNTSARATSSGIRLFEVLDTEPTIQNERDAHDLVIGKGVLRFDSVDFAYPGRPERKILTGISFELRAGRTLGIVGAPGSGKSTLAQLIPRFYDVTAGRISIDGQDIRTVTLQSLRQAVSLVQQETFLFDTSVHENVAYADPWAEEDQVIEATSIAQLHEHISGLPKGYATRVGERGVALSGGQRQRMSIARGLVSDPRVIVFDDSMSAIDASTERRVRLALRHAVDDRATLIISHRLGAIKDADEILVLDEGRIVERGNHAELLSRNGNYAALWFLQNGTSEIPPANEQRFSEAVTA
jgi:ATP-binding cassette, subfamily B, multidrug efflux pump